MDNKNMFQFVPVENGDLILFIYAREGEPYHPLLHLLPAENKIEFYRSGEDAFDLEAVDPAVFTTLQGKKEMLICEILPAENENEVEIAASYPVEISI